MTERYLSSRLVLSALLTGLMTGGPAVAETEGIRPRRATVALSLAAAECQVGDTVTMRLAIHGAQNVGSVTFHLLYDDDVLQFVPPVVEGPFMSGDGATTVFLASDAGGEITVGMARLGNAPGISGYGELARLSFEAIASGVGEFRFTGAAIKSPSAEDLPAKFKDARVAVVE